MDVEPAQQQATPGVVEKKNRNGTEKKSGESLYMRIVNKSGVVPYSRWLLGVICTPVV